MQCAVCFPCQTWLCILISPVMTKEKPYDDTAVILSRPVRWTLKHKILSRAWMLADCAKGYTRGPNLHDTKAKELHHCGAPGQKWCFTRPKVMFYCMLPKTLFGNGTVIASDVCSCVKVRTNIAKWKKSIIFYTVLSHPLRKKPQSSLWLLLLYIICLIPCHWPLTLLYPKKKKKSGQDVLQLAEHWVWFNQFSILLTL